MNPVTRAIGIARKMEALRAQAAVLQRQHPTTVTSEGKRLAAQYMQLTVQYKEAYFEAFGELPY